MDFREIDYKDKYKKDVLSAIDQGYKDVGYSGIELDSLDDDLNEIEKSYSKPSVFRLIFDKNKLIATYAVKVIKDHNKAELKRVYVDKNYRGQGLAKRISQEAFNYVQGLGMNHLDIWSGTLCHTAHHLYQKLGAQKTEQQRELGGVDDVIEYHFVKEL